MDKRINWAYFYIALWAVYYLQGVAYAEGSMLSQLMLACIMVMSAYYWYYANSHYKLPVYFKGINVLLGVITVYGIIRLTQGSILVGEKVVSSYTYLKDHYMSLLPIYTFFVFSKKGYVRDENLKKLLIVFLVLAIVFYYRLQNEYLNNLGREEFTNNSGYMFVQLFPLLFLCNWKIIFKFAVSLLIFVFVILTMKRGAILIGGACFLFSLFELTKNSSKTSRFLSVLASTLVIGAGVYFIADLYSSNDYFQLRVEETIGGNSSGRDHIYTDLQNHYLHETTIPEFVFGLGPDSTVKIAGNYAHNDWLELATCLGLVGLIAYLYYWIKFVKNIRLCKVQPYRNTLLMVFFILFTRTFFSMSINDIFLACSCALGFILANYKNGEATCH